MLAEIGVLENFLFILLIKEDVKNLLALNEAIPAPILTAEHNNLVTPVPLCKVKSSRSTRDVRSCRMNIDLNFGFRSTTAKFAKFFNRYRVIARNPIGLKILGNLLYEP